MLTNKELKARHEAGDKFRKDVQIRVNKELKRVCKNRDCEQSLAFMRSAQEFCSKKCNNRQRTVNSRLNREKKKRYYKRHGIVHRKTIKRKVPKNMGIEADGYNIIYENYKDPLKPIEKTKGFGYYGTLAMTEDKKYVQCHVCGKLFASLSGHIRQHNLTGKEYKEHFQLMTSTALVSEEVREIRIKNSLKLSTKTGYTELPIHLAEYNRKVQSGEIKHKGSNSWKLERRNKEGICPDQVLEKIKDLEEILGRTPTLEEFRSHYHNRYIKAIQYQHGSYLKAVAKAGLRSAYSLRHPDKESLVSELRAFYERYGRVPMTSDFKREMLRDRGVYIRAFGSLNNARVEAGLDAILPLPFGQKVILSPDEYLKYKETGKTPHYTPSKMAIRKRKARQKHLTPNNY